MSWFVALEDYHLPGAAVGSLLDAGYVCYRPRSRERVIRRGRKTWREGFLLGRYILVNLLMRLTETGERVADWAHQFHGAVAARGVAGVLATSEGAPFLVQDREVFDLRASERRGFVHVDATPKFSPGQQVRIVGGPMEDERGSYKFSSDKFDYIDIRGICVAQVPLGLVRAA